MPHHNVLAEVVDSVVDVSAEDSAEVDVSVGDSVVDVSAGGSVEDDSAGDSVADVSADDSEEDVVLAAVFKLFKPLTDCFEVKNFSDVEIYDTLTEIYAIEL